jgi:predicted ferric reductase
MMLVMAAGSVAAVTSLFRRIGQSRRAVGTIESLTHHYDNAVLDVGVQLTTAWPGHHAGQFAFVDFGGIEGAHPFTISSAWRRDGRLMFSIKGLGDYTRTLPERLFVGQAMTVEGPYGRFDFRGKSGRQIWIGGGIGITPFIAGLQALVDERREGPVDLIYSTNMPAAAFIDNIRQLAEKAGVRFHLLVTSRDGLLTLDRLERMIPEWKEADIWFCGPLGFGHALRDAMTAKGFPAARFHQELFDMR